MLNQNALIPHEHLHEKGAARGGFMRNCRSGMLCEKTGSLIALTKGIALKITPDNKKWRESYKIWNSFARILPERIT